MILSLSLLWWGSPSAFWKETVAVIKWLCASPHVLAEFGSEWCVHKETTHGAVVPSLPFMIFDSTLASSWDAAPSLHLCGVAFAGSETEFKGKLSVFLGSENCTCSAGSESPSIPSGSHVMLECPTVLKQGIWMVAMLVAIAVAASALGSWPDTVVSRTAPRCFSLSSSALLRCWLLDLVAWSILFVILIWGRLAYVVSLKGQQQRI